VELIQRLNNEGYRPARKEYFTDMSINALLLVLRRKNMIGSKPALSKPWWRSGSLSETLGINPATLTGWRHRGWVQAKQLGRRWIYWADADEMSRLRKLAAYPRGSSKPRSKELTCPASKMLDDPAKES
jgi:hypothetical protein